MKYGTFALTTALALVGPALSVPGGAKAGLNGPAKARHYVLLAGQQVTKETRDGIKNFARVETTVACAGAITADAMPEIEKTEAAPAFIHCASANRASAMWLIKRIVVDHWEVERAGAEAEPLGLTNAALKQWAIENARPDR
jgi:hypothetical protein